MAIVSDVEIRLMANIARLQSDMTSARKTVSTALDGMSKAAEKFKSLLVGIGAGLGISEIAKQLVDAQREFDKLNSSLITATGSTDNAAQAFKALQKFAASTPYDLKQTTEAFLKLRNLGLTPSERALRSYGNTAGALGKDLNQMVEAVADATTGEFERLKEFGIKAKQNGDQVSLTFQGVTTKIGNNAAAIEKYLLELGETKFAGGMELQAKTLDGAISNLGDTWQAVLRTINENGFGGLVKTAVLGLTDALTNLQYIIKAVGGESKKTGDNLESVGTISKVLTTVFETVAVLGANVWYVLEQTGKELGGLAAQAVSVLKGDFAGAAAIGKMMKEDAEASRKMLDERTAAILKASDTRKQVEAEEAKDTTDKLARYKVVAGAQNQATQTALDFYKKTMDASKDSYDALALETAGNVELTTEEKNRIKVLNDLEVAGKTLSARQKQDIKDYQNAIVYLAKYNAERQRELELRSALIQDANQQVRAAEQQSIALEEQIKYYGLTEEAVLKLKAAELARQLAAAEADSIEAGRLAGLLEETQRQADAQTKLTKMKADTSFWTGLEDAAHQTFLSIQDGGKDLWTRLKESAKNIFFEWLYQMTLKKWIINVGLATGGTGAVSGIAGAATVAGAAGSASAVTGQLSTLAGLGSLITSAGGIVTGAMQTAGALLTGTIGFGQTLSAGWGALTSGSAAGASAGLASIAGVVAPIAIAALVGSKLLGAAFGMGAKTVTSTTLSGTLTPTGANVSTLQAWSQKGGWFRSDKSGVDTTSVGSAQNSAFASTYKAILDVSKTLGDVIGADTAKLSTRVQQLKIDLTGITDATKQQEAIVAFFSGVADSISTELVPGLTAFQVEGETLSTTLQRVVTDYAAVDAVLGTIGKSMGSVGVASISARENLIKVAGGLDALASGVSYFQQNFLTDAERLAMTQKQLGAAMAELGLTGVTTVDQFKQTALGLDLNTEAGAKLFTQMLALAPAFKKVTDAADAAAKAQADAAKAQADAAAAEKAARDEVAAALAKTNQGYQDQIDKILAEREGAAAVRALEIKGMDASTVALYDRLAALNAETQALEDAKQAAQDRASMLKSAVGDSLDIIQLSVKAQKDANQSAFDQLMAGISASIDSTTASISKLQTLADALKGGVTTSGANYDSARAALAAAAQVARTSGVLPSADDIKDALAAVRADNSDQFSSLLEYQRAAAAANNDIASLAGVTDTQLSVAQATLLALQDQKAAAQAAYTIETARLDSLVTTAQAQLDALNGVNKGALSVSDALSNFAATLAAAMANPIASSGATTQSAYQQYLNRPATDAEVAYWQQQQAAGRDITKSVASSSEAQIQALYEKYLGRAGEAAGVNFYEQALASGKTWSQIEAGFAGSDEAQNKNNSLTAAVTGLQDTMATMQTAMNRTANATQQLASQFDNATGGGGPLLVKNE